MKNYILLDKKKYRYNNKKISLFMRAKMSNNNEKISKNNRYIMPYLGKIIDNLVIFLLINIIMIGEIKSKINNLPF